MPDQMLIIEDEKLLGTELQRHYRRNGWDAVLTATIGEAEQLLSEKAPEPLVVLSDLSLPDGNGLDLLGRLVASGANRSEWIFLTGFGDAPDAVRALRLGAFDFLTKPADMGRLDLVVAGAARSAAAQARLRRASRSDERRYQPEAFLGRSAAAARVRDMVRRLAPSPFSALIVTGETGTGKGLVARILHHGGPRARAPIVEINCAALPKELLESELFGHEAGAFTGAKAAHKGLIEQAAGGTLFLDEIAEMNLSLQPKLLKAIEDRVIRRLGAEREIGIDVQIIAATNRNLAVETANGRFRPDLYHRLNVFEIALPTLRSRPEDIAGLTYAFVTEFNAKAKKRVRLVPEKAWSLLAGYHWPGNVRELRNVIERSVLLSRDDCLPVEWLQLDYASGRDARTADGDASNCVRLPLDGTMALDDMDRHIIEVALKRHDYNVMATARALGTTRETLRYRVQKYGLLRDKLRGVGENEP